MHFEAKTLADSLVTPGYPYDWNPASVQRIGISKEGNVLSMQKLQLFHNMTSANYSHVKALFDMRSDWGIYFMDATEAVSAIGNISMIGHPNMTITAGRVSMSGISYDDLVSLSRVVHHNGSTYRMVVYAWR
jgi:hypothetical protein